MNMRHPHWIARGSDFIAREGVWKGSAWGISATSLMDGLGYLALGNKISAGPSSSLLTQFPFGMRSVGLVMTVVALGVLFTAKRRDMTSLRWLFALFALGIFITCFTIGGWINARHVAWGALSKWLLLSWLSLWLSATTWKAGGRAGNDLRA